MKKAISVVASALFFIFAADAASAAAVRRDNYVVFNIKGDCGLDDCIAAVKDSLHDEASTIVSIDASSLAPHQTIDYKTVIITFRDYKTAPYGPIMQKIAALGYNVISFVIHDTHTGQDVIIPH